MSNAPNELSFLPDDYMENKAQRRANVICAALFLVTMVSIGLAFTTSERSLKQVEQEHSQVEQDFMTAAHRIDQVQRMQEKQRLMAHQAELTASLLEKVPRSLILAKLTNALPAGVSLTDCALTSVKRAPSAVAPRTAFESKQAGNALAGKPAEATIYDVSVKISGLAPTDMQVGELMKKLKGVSIFKDVNLIISDWEKTDKKSQAEQLRKFQIEMMLDPNADSEDANHTTLASTGSEK